MRKKKISLFLLFFFWSAVVIWFREALNLHYIRASGHWMWLLNNSKKIPRCRLLSLQWCGNMEDPEPMTARLQDFAENSAWGYMAYKEMMFGIYCWAESSLCEDKYSVRHRRSTNLPCGNRCRQTRVCVCWVGLKARCDVHSAFLWWSFSRATIANPFDVRKQLVVASESHELKPIQDSLLC